MCEILIRAINNTHADADKDRRGCYKRGMPVVSRPDGHSWGAKERMPRFALIKIPGVSVDKVEQFCQAHRIDLGGGVFETYRCRCWIIRWDDLPQGAKDKLIASGELVIQHGAYDGAYDYTWDQIKNYFRNQETGLDGAEIV